MNTYQLHTHPEYTLVWRIFVNGRQTSAFVQALECPAPAGASQEDLAKLGEWLDKPF